MSWEAEAEEIRLRRLWADELGGAEAVQRVRERGALTVRERIAGLVDPGSFQEEIGRAHV